MKNSQGGKAFRKGPDSAPEDALIGRPGLAVGARSETLNVSLRQLRVFSAVVRWGNMTRAAEQLHLTPAAVSMQMRDVEQAVGLPLLERNGRSIGLTTAGEYFADHARRVLAAVRDAELAMARFRKLEHGTLTLGAVSTAKYFVPRLLARFHQEHPAIDVRLRVAANRESLLSLLADGDIDLAVMGRPPSDLATRAEAFAAHPLVFIAPPDHPLLAMGQIPAAALEGVPFIVREEGSGTRKAMQTWFDSHRLRPRITMEMSSNETIKQAVMAGLGLSFVSLHTIGLELRSGLMRWLPVHSTPVLRTWHIAHLQHRALSPAAEAFRYFMLEAAEPYLAEHDAPLLAAPGAPAPGSLPAEPV